MDISKIDPGNSKLINVIIEIPKGSNNKYEFDLESNSIKLDRVLSTEMTYPADYGFIPNTLADDGDPLDVLVLISNSTFPGCIIEARPIGVLKMRDQNGEDYKIISVANKDPYYNDIKKLEDLPKAFLEKIKVFFKQYKTLEKNKYSDVEDWHGPEKVKEIIISSITSFKKN
jgi:inorganic pyrophosphatase